MVQEPRHSSSPSKSTNGLDFTSASVDSRLHDHRRAFNHLQQRRGGRSQLPARCLELSHVDVGHGSLIFGLPPAEVAVHPGEKNDEHEFYLMCDDIEAFVAEMKEHKISCEPVNDQGWGLLSQLHLPGGGKLGVYQARHARPESM